MLRPQHGMGRLISHCPAEVAFILQPLSSSRVLLRLVSSSRSWLVLATRRATAPLRHDLRHPSRRPAPSRRAPMAQTFQAQNGFFNLRAFHAQFVQNLGNVRSFPVRLFIQNYQPISGNSSVRGGTRATIVLPGLSVLVAGRNQSQIGRRRHARIDLGL